MSFGIVDTRVVVDIGNVMGERGMQIFLCIFFL